MHSRKLRQINVDRTKDDASWIQELYKDNPQKDNAVSSTSSTDHGLANQPSDLKLKQDANNLSSQQTAFGKTWYRKLFFSLKTISNEYFFYFKPLLL